MSHLPASAIAHTQAVNARRQGVALFFCALVCFACYDAFCKWMLQVVPAPLMNLTRYISVSTIAMLWLLQAGKLRIWRTPCKGRLLVRGLALGIVATCFMAALVTMPLAEATAIYFTAPLMMVALSPALLGETVDRTQWCAVLAGFAGMLLIVRPGGNLPLVGTVLMVISAVCYALFQLLTRQLSGKVSGAVMYGWTALVCLMLTGIPALLMLPQTLPPWPTLLLILAGGACSGVAQLLLLAAFRRVTASTLAPLNYFQLLLAVLISTFVFHRPPDVIALAGIGMIMFSGGYLTLCSQPTSLSRKSHV